MVSSHSDTVSFETIIDSLGNLADLASKGFHECEFQRLTLNHRILAKLQADINKRDPSLENVSDTELLMIKRGTVFGWSALQSSIDFFRWSRNCAVIELSSQAFLAAKENSLLMTLLALRSILEITGNVILLKKDLEQLADPKDEGNANSVWLNEVESLIDGRMAGMRVDYHTITTKGLRSSNKFSYKPSDWEADLTAKDLLKGIDALEKRVKGARAAYEFFSEFAHPNLASVWTNYDRQELKYKFMDVNCYVVHHTHKKVGSVFLETFGAALAEGIEIVSECFDELRCIDLYLKTKGENVARNARKSIRKIIKHDPLIFDRRELCPCNSGKNIQQCCGRLIGKSKFGLGRNGIV